MSVPRTAKNKTNAKTYLIEHRSYIRPAGNKKIADPYKKLDDTNASCDVEIVNELAILSPIELNNEN